jgi:hypothetical protein
VSESEMPNLGGRPTRSAALSKERRDILILEMVEGGQHVPAISRALKAGGFARCSEETVKDVIQRELAAARSRRRDLAENVYELKLNQLDAIIRSNWGILNAPCIRCSGKGHIGQDMDREPGVNVVCDRCKGEMRQFPARDRAAASKEVRQAISEQCKLLGLYAPEKFSLLTDRDGEIDFSDEIKTMDFETLEKQFSLYTEAIDNERARVEQEQARV